MLTALSLLIACNVGSTLNAPWGGTIAQASAGQLTNQLQTNGIGGAAADFQVRMFGPAESFGVFQGTNFFQPHSNAFNRPRLTNGVVVSTGKVLDMVDMNLKDGMDYPPAGVVGDEAALAFQFTPSGESAGWQLTFDYVFASRELPELGGQGYNDNFKLIFSAPSVGVGARNIAVSPLDNRVIDVNYLTPNNVSEGTWSSLFVKNFEYVLAHALAYAHAHASAHLAHTSAHNC